MASNAENVSIWWRRYECDNASGVLFGKYTTALRHYLHKEFVVVNDIIIAGMLWADDLVLFPDAHKGFVTEIRRFECVQGAFQKHERAREFRSF